MAGRSEIQFSKQSTTMMEFAIVALGGAIGSMLRYSVQRSFGPTFPVGTFLVNIIGCFIIGILWAGLVKENDHQKRLLLMTGFCGGFTTFSAFTLDGIQMLMAGKWMPFFLYTVGSVACGLAATFGGYKLFNS